MTAQTDVDWRTRAACRGVDAEMFFPDRPAAAGLALHTCRTHCPVMHECDRWASELRWSGAVAGGRWYPERGQTRKPVPDARGCRLCLEADPLPTRPRPCGTLAAASRHRYWKEPLCDACRETVQAYDRERKRRERAS